ncbi:LysR family transcriptional regulator [Sphaerotilus hippei]|uniref:LysR family transcriptional regulator n=1 Tax=Sphaerotilus hippei TaxID=744406 RepID=A0A318GYJ5_9BURK|nr:LysR family transcriptional regulator [Sphaerotilus hippei]PXW95192.1 LysR family transcriptional regulator [Sphaerotilus hippei]
MNHPFSYRHLHYFWVVAHEGGMARGAERLGMAVQTVSAQVRELERSLGHTLLEPAGRGLQLTEAGRVALAQADQIFQLGQALPEQLAATVRAPLQRLRVGVSDAMPKLVAHALLAPALDTPALHLQCQVDEFEDLLADLALHRLDVVLADRPAPANPNLRLYSHALGSSALAWYAPPRLVDEASAGFPQSLARVPVLLPSEHAAVRGRLDLWFEQQGLRPHVVGEFEDNALLKAFGAHGMGVFPADELVEDELASRYGLSRVGACEGVQEHFFAIGTERRVQHPLVQRLLAGRS